MAKNITLMGANYSDVPAVELPQTGGGTARFSDASVTTATASDVAQGKYFLDAQGQLTAGTASGGGGSNIVQGNFKYTAEGWYTISLPYTGNGWPVAVIVSPKGGRTNSSIMTEIRRYAIIDMLLLLYDWSVQPIFNGTAGCRYSFGYKNSTSDASSVASNTGTSSVYDSTTPTTNSSAHSFRVSANKEIKVRMVDKVNNTSRYGFLINIDYTYTVIYSS